MRERARKWCTSRIRLIEEVRHGGILKLHRIRMAKLRIVLEGLPLRSNGAEVRIVVFPTDARRFHARRRKDSSMCEKSSRARVWGECKGERGEKGSAGEEIKEESPRTRVWGEGEGLRGSDRGEGVGGECHLSDSRLRHANYRERCQQREETKGNTHLG
jgi:hypothetical protein